MSQDLLPRHFSQDKEITLVPKDRRLYKEAVRYVYTHRMECCTIPRNDEIMHFAETWMELEDEN